MINDIISLSFVLNLQKYSLKPYNLSIILFLIINIKENVVYSATCPVILGSIPLVL